MCKTSIIHCRYLLIVCMCLFGFSFSYAQTDLSGKVEDSKTKEPLVGVSVSVKGKVIGTITDIHGNFKFSTHTPPPFEIIISSVGYKPQEITITQSTTNLHILLEDQSLQGQELVVSASRVAQSEMKSPVTVEKVDIRTIRETTATNFYDAMGAIKGINLTTQGLLFKSVNMRGFGATGNPRVVQMIDGMDNQAPGLNFSVDNIVGMPELDVESVEVLPGAASALYGPNAINGLILMNSKSPFLYQGLSASAKTGIMHESNRSNPSTPFYDVSLRYAKAFNNKFAYKVNLAYLTAKDWDANNFTNLNIGGVQDGSRGAGVHPDYDGTNIYGDEAQANMQTVAQQLAAAGFIPSAALGLVPNVNVSRTGIKEQSLVDNETKSFKANLGLHYRLTERVELIGQVNYGYGTTLYTGTGRYSLKDFNITQAKLELKADNFNVRAYTTQERSGKSAQLGLTALEVLNEIKPHLNWFGEYVGAFVQAKGQGANDDAAHLAARQFAESNRPGEDQIRNMADKYRNIPIINGGGGFLDKSNLYHLEGFYDFKNQIKFMDLMVGANLREYELQSNGTLFNDQDFNRNGKIGITEHGAFVQAGKSMFNNHFKLVGSLRYDKNENFDSQWSPRLSGVFSFGENNIRLSYQTGFRIPTTQNQYINLQTPSGTLIGGLPEFFNKYNLGKGIAVHTINEFSDKGLNYFSAAEQQAILANAQQYATAAVTAQQATIVAAVTQAVQQQVTAAVTAQVQQMVQAGQLPADQAPAVIQQQVMAQMNSDQIKATITQNVQSQMVTQITNVTQQVAPAYALAALPKYQEKKLKPERIESYEIGYKGLIGRRLFVDAYYYWSRYKDLIGNVSIVVPEGNPTNGLPVESLVASASTRRGFGRTVNSEEKITVHGWAAALNYSFNKGYNVGANLSFNKMTNFVPTNEVQYASFNTPEYTYNVSFGKRIGSGDRFGFNVNLRHQDAYVWENAFLIPTTTGIAPFQNTQVPAITNFDAQVSMKVPSIRSIVKLGGNNIGGKSYYQAFGSSLVGNTYYIGITFDQLFNK